MLAITTWLAPYAGLVGGGGADAITGCCGTICCGAIIGCCTWDSDPATEGP